ncbi:glyoxylate/hydroxypyruvate reductase A-like [Onthophagus taurus]|uniref:glyoxylate/hydroxypyruvate reductase A-like n=1 Tax=Onthophagus taurus TaxID=166361 RepID=UPI0039BDE748
MNSTHISVLTKIPLLLQELTSILPKINFKEVKTVTDPLLKQSEIIICDYDLIAPVLNDLPNTKWIQGTWAGVDKLLPSVNPEKPLPFTITRFSGKHFGRMMSEYVISQIVSHERSFEQINMNQKESLWNQDGKFSEFRVISDLNIGVMGLGQIGSWVVQILNMLGASVFGFGRKSDPDVAIKPYLNEYFTNTNTNLVDFLKKCDYVINILPNTVETKGLLSGGVLKNCKDRNAVFINIGRGSIISDEDLIEAMNKKWLSAAILDVFNTEPLPKESPLWKLPQVKITPHVSAPSRGKDIAEQFKENYHQYKNNGNLSAVLNIKSGY